MLCRNCKKILKNEIIDLGVMAPSNSYVDKSSIEKRHKEYPLKYLYVKSAGWFKLKTSQEFLVQVMLIFKHIKKLVRSCAQILKNNYKKTKIK